MAVEAYVPTLITVITTALVDSINPCAIGVLILMISVLLANHKSFKRILIIGTIYIASVWIVYFLAGLGLLYFFSVIPITVSEYISLIVGFLIVFAGILEIKDYFWYGQWFSLSIPSKYTKKIHKLASNVSITGSIVLGAFVAAVELPCTGGPYLAIITLLSRYFDFHVLILMVIYNIIFVLPLIAILVLVLAGKKIHEVKKWKQESKGFIRLLIGLLLVGLGWLLMLIANGTINLG